MYDGDECLLKAEMSAVVREAIFWDYRSRVVFDGHYCRNRLKELLRTTCGGGVAS